MRVLAVVNQKGGVSKSNLVVHLAEEAANKRGGGLRVAVLELDRQGTSTEWNEKRGGNLVNHIDAASLDQTLKVLRGKVDLVVLDLPGAQSSAINLAVMASDFILIPSRPTGADLSASAATLSIVHRLNKPYAFVFTFVESTQLKDAKEGMQTLRDEGHDVAPQPVGRRVAYADALATGRLVSELEPGGKADEEIQKLWTWISKQIEVKPNEVRLSERSAAQTRH